MISSSDEKKYHVLYKISSNYNNMLTLLQKRQYFFAPKNHIIEKSQGK